MSKGIAIWVFLILLAVMFGISFYWFGFRNSQIVQKCDVAKSYAIQIRQQNGSDYNIVNPNSSDSADKNIPMYVKDLNSRLDEYWGNAAFNDCLIQNGVLPNNLQN